MPSEWRFEGISFQYPENWSLDEEDIAAGQRSVTVYSPGGGFWSLCIYPSSVDPKQLAEAAALAMREEYEGLEAEAIEESINGRDLVGFDFNFFFLDLTNTAIVRCVRTDRATYAILYQAEDTEYDKIGEVFRAITASFVQSLRTLRYWDSP